MVIPTAGIHIGVNVTTEIPTKVIVIEMIRIGEIHIEMIRIEMIRIEVIRIEVIITETLSGILKEMQQAITVVSTL